VPVQPRLVLRDQEADDRGQPRDIEETRNRERREIRLAVAPCEENREEGRAKRNRHLEDGGIELDA
jgi:hypothetical protein